MLHKQKHIHRNATQTKTYPQKCYTNKNISTEMLHKQKHIHINATQTKTKLECNTSCNTRVIK